MTSATQPSATKIHRVERIVIQPSHANYEACRRFCLSTRRVYNAALYQMRQALFAGEPISASQADKILKQQHRHVYALLPSAAAQRTTQVLGDNWKGWLAAKVDYELNPGKYKARPRLPNYSKQAKTFVVNRNGYKIVNGHLHLSGGKDVGFAPLPISCCWNQDFNAKYNKDKAQLASKGKGRHIQSKSRKRFARINDYFHKASALDLDPLPVYEKVKKENQAVPAFSGKRIRRGLYRASTGRLINADINGSINILRKEMGDDWLKNQIKIHKGVMDTPVAVRHIDTLLAGSPRTSETTSKA